MSEYTPFKMRGPSLYSGSPAKQKDQDFSNAFAKARKEKGAGGTFTYKGKKYSTARKDDPSVAGQYLSSDLKDVDSGKQYTDPYGHTKKNKEGYVEDMDYIHHEGKITGKK